MQRRALLRSAACTAALAATLSIPAMPRAAMAAEPAFDHTLRIIVPNAPGGTSDIVARLIAPELTRRIGQPVVVENRAGAAGNIGADAVAKSPPDGHTLLLMDVATLAINPALFPRLPFDLERDLAPVSMLIYAPYLVAVRNTLGVTDAAALAARARATAGGLNVANAGVGSLTHLTAVELTAKLGGEATHVPYRGGAPALMAVTTGEADLIVNGATATLPFVANGQMRGIAVSGAQRLPALPQVPTFAELGWPLPEAGTWQGVLVQGGTPRPLVARLEAVLRETLAQPAIAARLAELGGEVRTDGPEAMRDWLSQASARYGAIVRAHNIRPE
ncbi:tripartite tricarboxylate transporter substrate binding protein [Pseudoroseomonas cervicalis]|uniref:Bug family tripartite tricarboxylate transporter substrate binding protein n=1 Tax=Teichococcus cervicalis TaxID=204525 RepID=UPI0022F1ADCA|nr:tripartite tricarboxylate transporter substrate-binding protein [Pseudoroseomonas cervicalis]WBV44097.1 tripartite tricarboxylate transporter substrate-binding protein [Pseudoroseomonas cervicalis]